eukprot:scaffold4613_cov129-Isochrysis_galbana.AAC.34
MGPTSLSSAWHTVGEGREACHPQSIQRAPLTREPNRKARPPSRRPRSWGRAPGRGRLVGEAERGAWGRAPWSRPRARKPAPQPAACRSHHCHPTEALSGA